MAKIYIGEIYKFKINQDIFLLYQEYVKFKYMYSKNVV